AGPEHLLPMTQVTDRGVRQQDFGVLLPARHGPQTGACLAEIAFLTNPAQARRLESDDYKQSLAQALADAVLATLHLPVATGQALAADLGRYDLHVPGYGGTVAPGHAGGAPLTSRLLSNGATETPLAPG